MRSTPRRLSSIQRMAKRTQRQVALKCQPPNWLHEPSPQPLAMNEPEFLTMSSITASGRPASVGGLLVALLTMLSLGIQQPAAAQDVDLRSLRNPLQDPRGQSPPEMDHVPSDVRDTAGMFSADAVRAARDALAKIERTIGVDRKR